MREYKNIQALQGHCNVPKVYDYIISKDQAAIILEKVPGYLLHTIVSSLWRKTSLLIIKNILDALSSILELTKNNFEVAHSFELKDIKSLIDNNQLKRDDFIKQSQGLTP